MRTIGFTGHRPNKLGGYDPKNEWNRSIREVLRGLLMGFKCVYGDELRLIAGGALGTDQWVMEQAIRLNIKLTAAIPNKTFHTKWPMDSQKHFMDLCKAVDKVYYVSTDNQYEANVAYAKRNQWIVEMSDILVAVWDGEQKGGSYDACRRAFEARVAVLHINPLKIRAGEFDQAIKIIEGQNDQLNAEARRFTLHTKKLN